MSDDRRGLFFCKYYGFLYILTYEEYIIRNVKAAESIHIYLLLTFYTVFVTGEFIISIIYFINRSMLLFS